ncbi:MAG: HD domain-containing protein, partial [Actinomycetota bacterium]|nr:HD domain-containing protein [Actinomycetota bacterium]
MATVKDALNLVELAAGKSASGTLSRPRDGSETRVASRPRGSGMNRHPSVDDADWEGVAALLDLIAKDHDPFDEEQVIRAYVVAKRAHEGQFRQSGEPYIVHPLSVAMLAAEVGLDEDGIAAALLHDAVEDTGVTIEFLESEFGQSVAAIVDGLTKLDRMRFDSKEAQQAATVRKMIVAMANDWRVLVIKLADRLHNMRTIAVMPEWKQRRTASETLDVYAPLAHRLGMQEMKWQLEDLAFATLHPKEYAEIERMLATRAPERASYIERVVASIRNGLGSNGIEARVTGRPKHLWSIYEKMVVRGKSFDEIFDLVGVRVVVESEKDCWAALGTVHGIWSPVHGRFK